jgi:hypothetical protein
VAAGLKAHRLLTDPALGTLYGSRWFESLLVGYEITLAIWLLSGVSPAACRRLAMATFAAFGGYALYLALSGAATCGCFGRVEVSPWWTLLLDSAAASMLWFWQPRVEHATVRRLAAWSAASIAIGLGAFLWLGPAGGNQSPEGIHVGDSFVLLEPEKWVGKQLPIRSYMGTMGSEVQHGPWLLLLYRENCSKCQDFLENYRPLRRSGARLALVSVSGGRKHLSPRLYPGNEANLDHLVGPNDWIVQTPVEIYLSGGRVMRVVRP